MEKDQKEVQRLEQELERRLETMMGQDHLLVTRDRTSLSRYLRARDWNVKEAAELLKGTVSWRKKEKPETWTCKWCREKTGYHAMRQVGHDALGRAVFYSAFIQMTATGSSVCAEDSVDHIVYLLEQAIKSMAEISLGAESFVWVMDCTGMFLAACSPKVAYCVNQILSKHYPERLAVALCVNSGYLMRGAFAAIKPFLAAKTAAKMQFMPVPVTEESLRSQEVGEELTQWLMEEIQLNAQRSLSDAQKHFWEAPKGDMHDPRGCDSYVKQFVLPFPALLAEREEEEVHQPHPNIVQLLKKRQQSTPV
eukprot:m.11961 g.11961  ORF g.11961 m.11961 type:complete len:308 (+) comp23697_c1_seq2:82-1005(+)